MKTSYHTHTERCMHAYGSDEDYVLSAIKGGYNEIGFSDHCPWKYSSDYVAYMRMTLAQFPEYKRSILALKEKYKDKISIKLGLECEYFPRYMSWLKEFAKTEELDYLIFGNHFYETDEYGGYIYELLSEEDGFQKYLKSTLDGMETGLFSYLAHPDLFISYYEKFDAACIEVCKETCKKALELDMPLEYNLHGFRKKGNEGNFSYPYDGFWEIAAEYGCKVILGADTHNNKHLEDCKYHDSAIAYLKSLSMNIVETISFLR